MGFLAGPAPTAPDPLQTSNTQQGLNLNTAQQQQMLNMVNQTGPYGSLTYGQSGTKTYTDANGKVWEVPEYTATTSFSPEQQKLYDQSIQAQTSIGQLAANQANAMLKSNSDPFSFGNQDAANWAYDLAAQRILPQQQRNQADLESQLVNSGVRRGTAAWDREMQRMTMANTDQLNQLALTGRQQAYNEQLAGRQQQMSELSQLTGGSQAVNPATGFTNTPQTQLAGVDHTGMVMNNYNNAMEQYNAKMGGLFGLGSSLIGAASSFAGG